MHVTHSIDELEHDALLLGELCLIGVGLGAIDLEDEVEARDLLLDQAPLVDPPRPLEKQRVRTDRHERVLVIGRDIRLEVERALGPREEEIHRLLDLHLEELLELVARQRPKLDEDLSDLLVATTDLGVDRSVQLLLGDHPVFHEHVAEPVAAIDDRRIRDLSPVEEDVAEAAAVANAQASGLLAHGQELEHVGKACFLETAADRHLCRARHHWSSSINRAPGSGHSMINFSGSSGSTSVAVRSISCVGRPGAAGRTAWRAADGLGPRPGPSAAATIRFAVPMTPLTRAVSSDA